MYLFVRQVLKVQDIWLNGVCFVVILYIKLLDCLYVFWESRVLTGDNYIDKYIREIKVVYINIWDLVV